MQHAAARSGGEHRASREGFRRITCIRTSGQDPTARGGARHGVPTWGATRASWVDDRKRAASGSIHDRRDARADVARVARAAGLLDRARSAREPRAGLTCLPRARARTCVLVNARRELFDDLNSHPRGARLTTANGNAQFMNTTRRSTRALPRSIASGSRHVLGFGDEVCVFGRGASVDSGQQREDFS